MENLYNFECLIPETDNKINYQIKIPFSGHIDEICHLIINLNNKSPTLFNYLKTKLLLFIEEKQQVYESQFKTFANTPENIAKCVKIWSSSWVDSDGTPSKKNDQIALNEFLNIYSDLLNSPFQSILCRMEANYQIAIEQLNLQYKDRLQKLKSGSEDTTSSYLSRQSDSNLADMNTEKIRNLKVKYREVTSSLISQQRTDFQSYMMDLNQRMKNNQLPDPFSEANNCTESNEPTDNDLNSFIKTNETYTINIGFQHKTYFDVSLIRCNFNKYFRYLDIRKPESLLQRYRLFSKDLTVTLLYVCTKSFTKDKKKWTKFLENNINKSPELIFPHYYEQIKKIRANMELGEIDQIAPGFIYTTKHSNLSQSHIIYHIVLEQEELKNNQRAPITETLSNAIQDVLDICFKSGCLNIDIPLYTIEDTVEPNLNLRLYVARAESILRRIKECLIKICMWENNAFNPKIRFLLDQKFPTEIYESINQSIQKIFSMKDPLKLTKTV